MPRIHACYRGGFNGRAGWWLGLEYDEDLIDRLKAAVPARERSYNDETHEWWFAVEQEAAVLSVLPAFEAFLAQTALF